MDNRARAFRATLIKLGAFVVVMVLVFLGLVVVFSNFHPGGTDGYKAVFTSASQITSGSKVKIAGVDVGTVNDVSLTSDNQARVRFSVDDQYRLPDSVRVLIRYANLTGDRYLEIQQGAGDPGHVLAPGATIGITQTEPALDLDKLLGGFKPLFRTLNPTEVNQLSTSLVAVFQGQGGTLNTLLADTASVTSAIADRDQLIGQVVNNLNAMLGTFDGDRKGLDTSLDQLQMLASGLAAQRGTIGTALTETAQTTTDLADLLGTTRPGLQQTLTSIGGASGEILAAEPFLRSLLGRLPTDYKMLSNLGSYGAWLQIYFCRIRLLLTGPGGKQYYFTSNDVMGSTTQAGGRCAKS